MKKRSSKILIGTILSLFLMSTSALAAAYSDPYVTPSIKGYTYSFTSEVWDRYPPGSHSTVEAVCYVKTDNNVPIGYMGGQARLFGIDGQIRQASSMTYNSKSIAGMFVYSPLPQQMAIRITLIVEQNSIMEMDIQLLLGINPQF